MSSGAAGQASLVPPFETGVMLALNAIENAVMVMNSPRCAFMRAMKVFASNDLASSAYSDDGCHRLLTTEWMGYEDVLGDETRFLDLIADAAARTGADWVLTYQNVSSLAAGFDLRGLTAWASRRCGRALVPIAGPRLDGDWLAGYDEVVAQMLPLVAGDPSAEARCDLLLVGHLLCRNEQDEAANVSELRRLLARLGVAEPRILLCGGALTPFRVEASCCACLPHAGARAREALRALGVQPVGLPMPLGLSGTVDWLRAVGRLLGRDREAEGVAESELAQLVPDLTWIVTEHLAGRRVTVVGDPATGAALASFLRELGMIVVHLFTLSRSPAPDVEPRQTANPSAEDFWAHLERDAPDLVVGSGAFSHLLEGTALPFVELSFPSYLSHALHPRPYLGFAGARWLVEASLNALLRRRSRR